MLNRLINPEGEHHNLRLRRELKGEIDAARVGRVDIDALGDGRPAQSRSIKVNQGQSRAMVVLSPTCPPHSGPRPPQRSTRCSRSSRCRGTCHLSSRSRRHSSHSRGPAWRRLAMREVIRGHQWSSVALTCLAEPCNERGHQRPSVVISSTRLLGGALRANDRDPAAGAKR